jgi:hypothetical protein
MRCRTHSTIYVYSDQTGMLLDDFTVECRADNPFADASYGVGVPLAVIDITEKTLRRPM